MKTIIVDDERLAREELKLMLSKYPQIEIIGEYKNTVEAEKALKTLDVELMFIDIQMPGETGLEFLERIDNIPRTIFVTAYDEHAIKAFELKAYDYILKPIGEKRLEEVIKKLEEETKIPESVKTAETLKSGDRIFIKDGDKVWFIKVENIRFFESDGNYVKVYFDDCHPLILRSLNSLNERLDGKLFFRANRKYLINLEQISMIDTWFNGGLQVEMSCGTKIEISRRQAIKFKDLFSI
ncbi:MAG TPA: response regulator transcription factor [Crocinitomix sp.]|nr:response regulator transcription factor [Crocinitomix sp.]